MKRTLAAVVGALVAAAVVFALTGLLEISILAGAAYLLLLGMLGFASKWVRPQTSPMAILIIAWMLSVAIPAVIYLWPRDIGGVTVKRFEQ